MLLRYRRYFAIAAFILLVTPLVVGFVKPDNPRSILNEERNLAPAPIAPRTGAEWLTLSKQIDAFLQDRFGLRQFLIRTHKDLTKPLLASGKDTVLIGRDGRMFYFGEDTVRQSAGLMLRRQRVSETVALLARMNAALAARGIRFLVAVPPNGATTYQDFLPAWAQNDGRRTEYDEALEELAAKGVRVVDLRAAVEAVRSSGPAFYMYDSHWTVRGAVAEFDAVVAADGHPDWRIDPKSAFGPLTTRNGGDLARMLGVEDGATEKVQYLAMPRPVHEPLSANPDPLGDYVADTGEPGPTIMVIGDSFTGGYVDQMLMPHVARLVWLHHRSCRFDWSAIDRFHPAEVWWMPTERYLLCAQDAAPENFDG